jgi:predicted glycoside hydrolase/deacetylase ChbG (UPF0249 family)
LPIYARIIWLNDFKASRYLTNRVGYKINDILCADDYGQTKEISEALIRLVENNRLSAINCMTNKPAFQTTAVWLKSHIHSLDIGLHFNLPDSLLSLLLRAKLRLLNFTAIEEACKRQLDKFVKVFNQPPDFIDGHQHIHQFPVICDALVTTYKQYFCGNQPYIRYAKPNMLGAAPVKRFLIRWSKDRNFLSKLKKAGIPHNQRFEGVYDFKSLNYAKRFPEFLKAIQSGGLIMCHPGLAMENHDDSIAKSRYQEFQYLSSDAFLIDCKKAGITLCRFRDI